MSAKKGKTPRLADWEVSITGISPPLRIRATRLRTRDGFAVLEDVAGEPVFAAPASTVRYVRVLGDTPELGDPVADALSAENAAAARPRRSPGRPAPRTVTP